MGSYCQKSMPNDEDSNQPPRQPLTAAVLLKQDDRTSESVIKLLHGNGTFKALSGSEGKDIIKRDAEDETKLAVGIQIAVAKGVLEASPNVSPVRKIDVVGKTADAVAQEILAQLPGKEGNIVILQGLSGTGKGTTVQKLQQLLPKCVCWSNGNVFRSLTWMANDHCAKHKLEFGSQVLTADLVKSFVRRMEFKQFGEVFDVVLDGKVRVSEIQNTELKAPLISSRVPTVAEQTQGEVVLFAAAAVETLRSHGHNVILEGRAQTLNYIPSKYRFELCIPDPAVLGERRAAQRVVAKAAQSIKPDSTVAQVEEAVIAAVHALS